MTHALDLAVGVSDGAAVVLVEGLRVVALVARGGPNFQRRFLLDVTRYYRVDERVGNGARQTKVAQANLAVGLNENVGGLDVAVHQVGGVQEVQGAQRVVEDARHVVLVELYVGRGAENFLEVGSGVVHDDEEVVKFLALLDARQDQVVDLGGERVALHFTHAAHDIDLAEDLLGSVVVLEQVTQQLDSDNSITLPMTGLHDLTEATLAEYRDQLIVILNAAPEGVNVCKIGGPGGCLGRSRATILPLVIICIVVH